MKKDQIIENLVIGCVGKPSAGKSTFLNSVCPNAKAKVGDYPFTTINPNMGVTFYPLECPCKKYNCSQFCSPMYGKCVDGKRFVPVKVLDVAGLIPGASEGKGLGNKFLDDLRTADVLLHVVDVSGTTNEKGQKTEKYDPINDITWLNKELHDWIFGNLWSRWPSIVRRHCTTKNNLTDTLTSQLAGYSCNKRFISKLVDHLPITITGKYTQKLTNENIPEEIVEKLDLWSEDHVHILVWKFLELRFPTIYVLNKIDMKSSSKNIERLYNKYNQELIILTSSLSECFLQQMVRKKYIKYEIGGNEFITLDDRPDLCSELQKIENPQQKQTLEQIRTFILERYGSTGVLDVVIKAVQMKDPIAVFPVDNIHNFTCDDHAAEVASDSKESNPTETSKSESNKKKCFTKCHIVQKGTTLRQFVDHFFLRSGHGSENESKVKLLYVEGVSGRRMSDQEVLGETNCVFRVVLQNL